jgi:hypothetical protein
MTNEGVTHYVLSECERRGRRLNAQVSSILQQNSLYQSAANKTAKRHYPILPVIKDADSGVLYYKRGDVAEWTTKLINTKSKGIKQ